MEETTEELLDKLLEIRIRAYVERAELAERDAAVLRESLICYKQSATEAGSKLHREACAHEATKRQLEKAQTSRDAYRKWCRKLETTLDNIRKAGGWVEGVEA